MERFDWSGASDAERRAALARPSERDAPELIHAVRGILDDVRVRGWPALVEQAIRLDGSRPTLVPVAPYAKKARDTLPGATLEAIALAGRHIEAFHLATRPSDVDVQIMPGLLVGKHWRPLPSVGLYVPGGMAPLFSTLMMLAIPARVAGVERITVVTPPRADGGLDPAVALAAEHCGITEIWTVGGAQAIAALAFGAGDIPRVDKICGPGNAWVAAAKSLVASMRGGPGIDLPAGPSELMVIADESARPSSIAADLLSQAEHDVAAQVILVSASSGLIEEVAREVERKAEALSGKLAVPRAILCSDLPQAIEIANTYAPEHLSLAFDHADENVARVQNSGAIFVGHAAAESFGDYLAGSSHVLPTDGAARFTGGVSTMTFMKAISVQKVSAAAASSLARPAAVMARLEGLEAHARAAEARA